MSAPAPASGRTALYRLYDGDGQLLYVGVAATPHNRWATHAHTKSWWSQVARFDIEWFPSRKRAEQAESEAIALEAPRHNVNGVHGALADAQSISSERGWGEAFRQIADDLRQRITDGGFPEGTCLPSESRLTAHYGVARGTVRRALKELTDQGLVQPRKGSGVWVQPAALWADEPATEARTVAVSLGSPETAARVLMGAMGVTETVVLVQELISELASRAE